MMYFQYKKLFAAITLFFFLVTICSSPVLAQSNVFAENISSDNVDSDFPVAYVTPQEMEQIVREAHQRGYTVRQGTWQQLAELEQGKQVSSGSNQSVQCNEEEKTQSDVDGKQGKQSGKCQDQSPTPARIEQPGLPPAAQPAPPSDPPEVEPLPPPQPDTQHSVQTNIGIYADVSYGSGGGGRGDAAKVFFIVAGILAIAAFIVYAGKYISDLVAGKDYDVWWEFVFTNNYLSAGSGQHGRFNGVKIGTGFVSSDLIQIALLGEVGKTDIDLILNEDSSNPAVLDFSATYWLLGGSVRLHLTDKLVNASYLYIDFMGGKTSHGSTDTIGMARLGASFGVNDHLRLGASIGSVYLGLDEDEGFANDGDNYWTTLGFEIGAKF